MILGTEQIMSALASRYKAPEWAFLPQVADATGFAKVRTADALAMSLWPSRGLHLHGFEVKKSRGDWLKELRIPAKAESICRFCDFWWVAIGDPKIVLDGELPPTWGLLTPKGRGLAIAKQAPPLKPKTMDRSMLAALLRKAADYVAPKWVEPVRRLEQDEWQAAFDKGVENGKRVAEHSVETANRRVDEVEKRINEFEAASGVRIDHWDAGRIGEAVAILQHRQHCDRALDEMKRRLERAEREVEHCREQVASFGNLASNWRGGIDP